MAATGLMYKDEQGFMQIAADHDPEHSAVCMVEFAKAVQAHARTVMMPNSDKALTVGSNHM